MRILHVISRMDPSDGGPPMALSRLAAAQAELGAGVTLVALEPQADQATLHRAYGDIPGFRRVRQEYVPAGGWLEQVLARSARARLQSLIAEHAFVHVHGIWRPHLLQAARTAAALDRPYAISPHGMLSTWSLEQKAIKKRLALHWGWRQALERAAFIHVLNRDEADAVARVCAARRLVTVPNGVNLAEVNRQPPWETVRSRYPQLNPSRYIAFVGRLHHSKGLDLLATAFAVVAAEVPDVRLVVMGPEFGAGPAFRAQVQRLGIAHRVDLLGPVYGCDKAAILHHAACFCLPSRQEGFSMAIVEALAFGLPAVITEACHFPEVAEAQAGYVVPLDGGAIGRALIGLLRDETRRVRCADAARRLSHGRYQWGQIANEFLSTYAAPGTASTRSSVAA